MPATVERLLGLTVGDVMAHDVHPIPETLSMAEVAKLLFEYNIAGAPVVNADGICVGVINSIDFVRRELQIGGGSSSATTDTDQKIEDLEDCVSTYISKELQATTPEAPLMEAAQQMSIGHIRRLPVINSEGQPIGILTMTDLVAVIVNIVDEFRNQGN